MLRAGRLVSLVVSFGTVCTGDNSGVEMQAQAHPRLPTAALAPSAELHETFNDLDGNGDGFDLSGWVMYGSSFGLDASGATFVTDSTAAGNVRSRFMNIVRVLGIESNRGVDYTPYGTPKAEAGQWPYLLELLGGTSCSGAAEVLVRTLPYTYPPGADTEVYGLLINYRVSGEGPTRRLTGYQLLVNGGGESVTLSRFIEAPDHSLDYLDRFPGCLLPVPACTPPPSNPLVDGPYKGWDYRPGLFPAGGNPADLTENVVAVRYEYDAARRLTTLRWELRRPDGSDDTPDSWDVNRVLDGEDALPPGGAFGYFVSLYAKEVRTLENGLRVTDFRLRCED